MDSGSQSDAAKTPAPPRNPDSDIPILPPKYNTGIFQRGLRPHKRHSESSAHSNIAMDDNNSVVGMGEKKRRRRHTDYTFEADEPYSDGGKEHAKKKARLNASSEQDIKNEELSPKKKWDIVTIGTHIDEPCLPIIAEMTDDGTIRTIALQDRTMPSSILQQWETFFAEDGTIPLDKIQLSSDHFKDCEGAEPLDPAKKYELIKEFLRPTKRNRNGLRREPVDQTPTKIARPVAKDAEISRMGPKTSELQVGVYRADNYTPVYAYLRQDTGLMFRVHEDESDLSTVLFCSITIKYEQIIFDEQYKKVNERATRIYIRSLLRNAVKGPESPGDVKPLRSHNPGTLADLSQNVKGSWADLQGRVKTVVNKVIKEQEASAHELSDILQEYGKNSDRQAQMIKEQAITIDRQIQTIELLRSRLADYEAGSNEKEGNMNKQVDRAGPKLPAQFSATSFERFSTVPSDKDNAGMLLEKQHRQVQYNGSYYNERIILQELKTVIRGKATGEKVDIDGMTSACYEEDDGSKKFIERPQNARSFIETDSGYFVKWVKREEITVEEYWRV